MIDVGLDYDNPDLNIETSTSFSVSTLVAGTYGSGEVSCPSTVAPSVENFTAEAQHASFIAELAGAIDNSDGGIGVAPNAKFVSIKAIDCDGMATTGSVLRALAFVSNNCATGDVVNLSLGTSAPADCASPTSSAFYQHYQTITNVGAFVVVAAGNTNINVNTIRPACYDLANFYTVSSVDCQCEWADRNY